MKISIDKDTIGAHGAAPWRVAASRLAVVLGMVAVPMLALLMALVLAVAPSAAVTAPAARADALIETPTALWHAIQAAQDGDVLTVGDIDFGRSAAGQSTLPTEGLPITKSLAIVNGKASGNALFAGGGFMLNGPTAALTGITLRFVGITFDGMDADAPSGVDWARPKAADGLRHAIVGRGGVEATFSDCVFTRYRHTDGAALYLIYDERNTTDDAPDDVVAGGHRANYTFVNCRFEANTAHYSGGAVYINAGFGSVDACFTHCTFDANRAGAGDHNGGGGALYCRAGSITMRHCRLQHNVANCAYAGDEGLYDTDLTLGGAIYAWQYSDLSLVDCVLADNQASRGGAIAIRQSDLSVDGCILDANRAVPALPRDSALGDTHEGLGGALYCDEALGIRLINTDITRNTARCGCGILYLGADPLENAPTRDVLFCTIADNTVLQWSLLRDEDYIWGRSNVNLACTILIDEIVAYFGSFADPVADNAYCYLASPDYADANGYGRDYAQTPAHLVFANAPLVRQGYAQSVLDTTTGDWGYNYTIGANAPIVQYRCYVWGRLTDTITTEYLEVPTLPTLDIAGYSHRGWYTGEGVAYTPNVVHGGNQGHTLSLYAILVPDPVSTHSLPVYAIALIILGAVVLVVAAVLVTYRLCHRPA